MTNARGSQKLEDKITRKVGRKEKNAKTGSSIKKMELMKTEI